MESQSPLKGTLIVIPAFNEAGNLAVVLAEIRGTFPGTATLVVDDGSTDGTSKVAASWGIPVLTLPFNLGVGAAMRLGFKYAQKNGFTSVIQVDADGQHVPGEIYKLLDKLTDNDVVIGSRFAKGATSFDVGGIRRVAMRILAYLLSRITKSSLSDVTSGFRASGPRAISLFATSYPPEYLGDTIESLVIAHRNKLSIAEVPTTIRERNSGSSSQSTLNALVYTLRALVVIFLSLLHRAPKPEIEQVDRNDQ
jgi:glycosyltransferase involved in cell wall biosynthesis